MTWWLALWQRLRRNVALSDYYLAFVLLNLLDLVFTGAYLSLGGSEANAAAAWILRRFGLRGLALFKFALVTLVVGVCEAAYTRRPAVSRALILAGCAVYGVVVLLQIRGILLLAFT
ncbi:MAG: DUF5658 family protein [Armatimonadota bacterium]|nr:DUF5658 family protein [Armatimonadota bacterium]